MFTLESLPQRWQDRVVVSRRGCWVWQGATNDGYAWGTPAGAKRPARLHRVTYQLLIGPIAEETLDHLCRVRPCINPAHLRPASNRENILAGEGPTARNARKKQCDKGHQLEKRKGFPGRYCPTCHKRFQSDWQKTHPENARRRKQRYKLRHPGRAAELARARYLRQRIEAGLTVKPYGPRKKG